MNFRIGQKIVCICGSILFPSIPPFVGEVYTIDGFDHEGDLYLVEITVSPYPNHPRAIFLASHFRPLLGESAQSELISSFVEVTETSDCPIKTPQPETI